MLALNEEVASDGALVVSLEGEATVENLDQVKEALLAALLNHDQVLVNCDRLESIDIFFIQLLCSAHRTAVAQEKKFALLDSLPSSLRDTVKVAGFIRQHGCRSGSGGDRYCLWI
ncbi:STAS domain-containing protein [Pelobacter seleniigenes]|uniref:STAS domain-containing protein n=1 Tax=Pelobacter seleniigenes TaxID=407188 RepID=UPI0004A6C925|nr:STAS domain-containing protein [Pelobacter seleniigenes]